MFPNGLLYEGVDESPRTYRGETGANDNIIPTLDNLFQIADDLPNNPLTEILKDFRQYRPKHHNEWLSFLHDSSNKLGVRKFALEDSESAFRLLANFDQIRDFRNRHWNLTKEYILKNTKHTRATGGSPIVTWLPN